MADRSRLAMAATTSRTQVLPSAKQRRPREPRASLVRGVAKRVKLHRLRWERRGQPPLREGNPKRQLQEEEQTTIRRAMKVRHDPPRRLGNGRGQGSSGQGGESAQQDCRQGARRRGTQGGARAQGEPREEQGHQRQATCACRGETASAQPTASHRLLHARGRIQPAELDQPVRRAHDRPT